MSYKHSAVLPDGKVAKRVSQNRQYAICIAGRRLYEVDLAKAQAVSSQERDRKDYEDKRKHAAGEPDKGRFVSRYPDLNAKWLEENKAFIAENPDREAWVAGQLAKRIAHVEAEKAKGEYKRWGALGWSSRSDLAEKAAGQWRGQYEISFIRAVIA